ncbi:MAG: hypothetical protein ABFC89_03940 [Methanospirillum sp.]
MADVSYVLPDTLRGDPSEREAFALRSGCDLVEVPVGDAPPPALPWLLRAASTDEDGRDRPRWHDRLWTDAFVREGIRAADRAPATVVIEPGDEWSRPTHLVRAIVAVREGFLDRFGAGPTILVANRADQSIPDGAALAGFWDHLLSHAPDLAPHTGIALDAPEFYAATRTRMTAELALVPTGALRYLRIHTRGRKPDLGEALPWRAVFDLVRRAPGTVQVVPAVRDPAALDPAILFCMVSLQGRAFT